MLNTFDLYKWRLLINSRTRITTPAMANDIAATAAIAPPITAELIPTAKTWLG